MFRYRGVCSTCTSVGSTNGTYQRQQLASCRTS